MSKSRLSWIFALILVIITSLPVAHAQGIGGSRIFFILINAAVVFVVLFILQSFLIPGKDGKEKTSMWVIVILISLVIAFLYGQTGYLWESGPLAAFFNIKVLVNAAIIGAILYFLLGLLKIKLNSKEGNAGYGILLFLISAIFAVKLGNQWIWDQAVLSQFLGYFFGSEGILNPSGPEYRLWVFIGSFTMLSFFFTGFLLKEGVGAGGKNFVSYALAFVMASNMASEGATIGAVIVLGEIFFVIMISQALYKTFGGGSRWALAGAIISAIILVGWASAAVTLSAPEYRGYIGEFACATPLLDCEQLAGEVAVTAAPEVVGGAFETIKSFAKWGFGIIILIIVAVIGIFVFGGETAQKAVGWGSVGIVLLILGTMYLIGGPTFLTIGLWMFVPLLLLFLLLFAIFGRERGDQRWSMLKIYGFGPFLLALRKSNWEPIKKLLERFRSWHNPFISDALPLAFRQMRVELLALMNWQTRLHTYFGKHGLVKKSLKKVEAIEDHFRSTPRTHEDLSYVLDIERLGEKDKPQAELFGWSKNIDLVEDFFKAVKQQVEDEHVIERSQEDQLTSYNNLVRPNFVNKLRAMSKSFEQYQTDCKKMGLVHVLRSIKISILDLVTLFGVFKHYYRFAHEDSIFELWEFDDDSLNKKYEDDKVVVWGLSTDKMKRVDDWSGTLLYDREKELLLEKLKAKKKDEWLTEETNRQVGRASVNRWNEDSKVRYSKKLTQAQIRQLILDARAEVELHNQEITYEAEAELKSRTSRQIIRDRVAVKMRDDTYGRGSLRLGFATTISDGQLRHEVNIHGFVLEDIHKIEVDHNENPLGAGFPPKTIRRVRVEDIEDLPGKFRSAELEKWGWVYNMISTEWDFFLEDLRYGEFHPSSRNHRNYTEYVLSRGSLDFRDPTIPRSPPKMAGESRAAFDVEALAYSGKYVYWGRRNYWDKEPDDGNPYPTLSTIALSRIITSIARLQEGLIQNTDDFLKSWVYDTGATDTQFTTILKKEGPGAE